MVILKLIGAVILLGVLAAVVFIGDLELNQSRLFYAVVGRDTLVSLCTPPVRSRLVERGFSPADLEFDDQPSISVSAGASGRNRTLSARFTFSDGPNGPRVDGDLVCRVGGGAVTVEVNVDALPIRAA